MDERQAFRRAIARIEEAIIRAREKHKTEIDALTHERAFFEERLRGAPASSDSPSMEKATLQNKEVGTGISKQTPDRRKVDKAVLRYLQLQPLASAGHGANGGSEQVELGLEDFRALMAGEVIRRGSCEVVLLECNYAKLRQVFDDVMTEVFRDKEV